jgi:hypothetical protein
LSRASRSPTFFVGGPVNLRELMADLTWFFRWPPSEVESMTLEQIKWWQSQLERIADSQSRLATELTGQ